MSHYVPGYQLWTWLPTSNRFGRFHSLADGTAKPSKVSGYMAINQSRRDVDTFTGGTLPSKHSGYLYEVQAV